MRARTAILFALLTPAAGLGAQAAGAGSAIGTVFDSKSPDSRLTVLVGLLTNVDRVTGAIPIVGYVFGGSMTALPVSVSGDIRNPLVVPLGPRAITDSLLGIFERTLKLPGKLAVPSAETKTPEK